MHAEEAYIRAQIAVSIGCDVLVNGIKGCGPDKVMKKISEIKRKKKAKMIRNELEQWMASELNIPKKAVDTFCKAFVCEPCNEDNDNPESYNYLWKPTSLPNYLAAFRNSSNNRNSTGCKRTIKIDHSLKLDDCVGTECGGMHKMLSVEVSKRCVMCNKRMCSTCFVKSHNKLFVYDVINQKCCFRTRILLKIHF